MELMLISGIYPPDIGGPSTFIPGFEKFLTYQGNNVKVLTLTDEIILSKAKYTDVVFISRRIKRPLRQFVTIFQIAKNSSKSETIFANGLFEETALVAFLLRKKLIFKIVGDPIWERYRNQVIDPISIEEFNDMKLPLKYQLQRVLLRWSLEQSKEICTPSEQLSNFITKWGVKTPVKVIANGVSDQGVNSLTEYTNDVITVSRLVSWKNIPKIISACHSARLSLSIVGEGRDISVLKKYALDMGADVTFLGSLTGDKLEESLSNSKVFCLYSDYEGLSFALVSALMRGMFVVASDIPGNRNAITHNFNGVLVPLNDIDQLSKALTRAINDKVFAKQIQQNARINAMEKYLDIKCYEKTLQLMVN